MYNGKNNKIYARSIATWTWKIIKIIRHKTTLIPNINLINREIRGYP